MFLKQSTAATLRIGPFMDIADGVTPETGITLGAADQAEILKATGATVDITAATFAAITGADGWYDLSLTTSHTDTLGMITVIVQDASVCLPVFVRAMVLPANVFDSLVAGSDNLQVDATQWAGAATATDDLALVTAPANFATLTIADNAVAANVTRFAGTAATSTAGIPSVNLAQWLGTAPVALSSQRVQTSVAAMQTGVVTADAVAADAIGASELATDAVTEIVNAVFAKIVETEGSYTLQQALSIILAVLAGETASSGATILTPNGNATRVAATLAANERTAMTLTPSS